MIIYRLIMWSFLVLFIMNFFEKSKKDKLKESKKSKNNKIKENYISDNRLKNYDDVGGIYPNILFSDTKNCEPISFQNLNSAEKRSLFKLPKFDKLNIHRDNTLIDDRINSVNNSIIIKNPSKLINELNTNIFNPELIKLIDKNKLDYVDKYVDYDKLDEDYMPYLIKTNNDSNKDDSNKDESNKDESNKDESNTSKPVKPVKPVKDDKNIKDTFYKLDYNYITDNQIKNFNKITNYLLNKINSNSKFKISGNQGGEEDFKIVQNKINYILQNKNNKNELLYDFDIVIYRDGKGHGIHISCEVLYNESIYITDIGAVGIVTDDKIFLITSSNEYLNDLVYYKYNNKYVMIRNPREDVVSRMTPMEKVDIMRERARKLLLDRGLHINNVDNSNNLDDNIPN